MIKTQTMSQKKKFDVTGLVQGFGVVCHRITSNNQVTATERFLRAHRACHVEIQRVAQVKPQ